MNKPVADTNILVRYLIDGDKTLAEAARKTGIWLPNAIVFEAVYVMRSVYKVEREEIFEKVARILLLPGVESERDLVFNTLADFKTYQNLGLTDCYVLNIAKKNNIEIVTKDQDLLKIWRKN
jgi:predicted nucleic acid-binding protein